MATRDRDDRDDDDDDFDDRPRRRRRDEPDPAGGRAKAAQIGVALIVVGAVSLLMVGLGVVQYATIPAQMKAERQKIENDPQFDPQAKKTALEFLDVYEKGVMTAIPVLWGVATLSGILMIVGGVKTKNLSSLGWGKAAAWLGMIPCVSGCCLLGLPIGIWALVGLGSPDVKAAFAAARRSADGFDDGLTD